jgi:hypothetical protein
MGVFEHNYEKYPGFIVLVLMLNDRGSRTRCGIFVYEYEYHFIEYEYE